MLATASELSLAEPVRRLLPRGTGQLFAVGEPAVQAVLVDCSVRVRSADVDAVAFAGVSVAQAPA